MHDPAGFDGNMLDPQSEMTRRTISFNLGKISRLRVVLDGLQHVEKHLP